MPSLRFGTYAFGPVGGTTPDAPEGWSLAGRQAVLGLPADGNLHARGGSQSRAAQRFISPLTASQGVLAGANRGDHGAREREPLGERSTEPVGVSRRRIL
jgi:hypothetical protein